MKHIIYPILMLVALQGRVAAQNNPQLVNPGFEDWNKRSLSYHEDPVSWFTLSPLKQYGYPSTCVKTTDAHSGNYAILLETKAGPFSDIPGILTSGNMLGADNQPDFDHNFIPFNGRPSALHFWFKSTPALNDSVLCSIVLTKWNSTTMQRDTVAELYWQNKQVITTYTETSASFIYYSSEIPDSMSFLFSTSTDAYSPVVGSRLFVDDLFFVYNPSTFVQNNPESGQINFFPNPTHESITITHQLKQADLHIFDVNGNEVFTLPYIVSGSPVSVNQLKKGVYLMALTNEYGIIVLKSNLIVTY